MSMCTPASAGQCGGDESDLIEALTALDGVIAAEQLDDETMKVVTGIETSIRTVSGGMRIENRGILDCAGMSRNYVLFCGSGFPRPEQVTMEMVDDAGEVVGHDVPPCMVDAFRSRDDVIWMSDGFVLYPGLVCDRDVRMVMLSSRMKVSGPLGEFDVRSFYPSASSAEYLLGLFGREPDRSVAAVILGVDGVLRGQFLCPM
ncbi:MAG TPA: hypothetical protein IAC83_05770 [Euryarchaeota archaeon]|nr:hypothetical protein [Euryarchaeota archaeon]